MDSGLFCPACDYNLTGLTESRCPECGTTFDLEDLKKRWSTAARPATPWDDPGGFTGFWRTWLLVMTDPTSLASEFPRRYVKPRAVAYSWICYTVAVVPCAVLAVVMSPPQEPAMFLAAGVAPLCGFSFCETVLARLLALLVEPTYAKERFWFWRGLIHYSSGFAILSGALVGLLLLLAGLSASVLDLLFVVLVSGLFVILPWWATTVSTMILERSRGSWPRWLVSLLVLGVGLAAIGVGVVVFWALMIPF